jgi:hypothetical protein
MNSKINLGHAIFIEFDEHHYAIITSLFLFFFLAIYLAKKKIKKLKALKSSVFSSIARIKPQFKKDRQISTHGSSR